MTSTWNWQHNCLSQECIEWSRISRIWILCVSNNDPLQIQELEIDTVLNEKHHHQINKSNCSLIVSLSFVWIWCQQFVTITDRLILWNFELKFVFPSQSLKSCENNSHSKIQFSSCINCKWIQLIWCGQIINCIVNISILREFKSKKWIKYCMLLFEFVPRSECRKTCTKD
jgi:hypothetical protein